MGIHAQHELATLLGGALVERLLRGLGRHSDCHTRGNFGSRGAVGGGTLNALHGKTPWYENRDRFRGDGTFFRGFRYFVIMPVTAGFQGGHPEKFPGMLGGVAGKTRLV